MGAGVGRNAMSEGHSANESAKTNEITNSINRRRFVKALGATGGAGAFGMLTQTTEAQSTFNNVKELNGSFKKQVVNQARSSLIYQTYRQHLPNESVVEKFDIINQNASVYRVINEVNREYEIIEFPIDISLSNEEFDSQDTGSTAAFIVVLTDTSVDASIILERINTYDNITKVVMEIIELNSSSSSSGLNEDNPSAQKSTIDTSSDIENINRRGATATIDRKEGELLSREQYVIENNEKRPIAVIQQQNCQLCRNVFSALCSVGCSVSAGVPCAIATGGTGAAVCPVIVGLLCAYYGIFSGSCPPADITRQDACEAIGYC